MGTRKRWITVAILTLTAALLFSGCTRERIADETGNSLGAEQQSQEPVVTQLTPLPTATETPLPTPENTPEPKVITYEVRPGDTISAVAEKFGTDPDRIRALNLLTTDALQVGQVLRVPYVPGVTTPDGLPTATPEPLEYTVQEGDTLLSIALYFNVSLNEITTVNALADQHNLVVGQVLIIPGAAAPDDSVPNANSSAADPALSQRAGTHMVRAGETLALIAERYDVSLPDLIAFNSNTITNPHVLSPGTVLFIPGLTAADIWALNQTVYTVQDGDSLLAIAERFGVSVDAILETNNLTDPNLLRAGDQLVIPDTAP